MVAFRRTNADKRNANANANVNAAATQRSLLEVRHARPSSVAALAALADPRSKFFCIFEVHKQKRLKCS